MADEVADLDSIRTCIDRQGQPKAKDERMALVRASMWQPGDAIHVAFLDGDGGVQQRVRQAAEQWMDHTDLRLYFVADSDANIRISFQQRGSWSYIGTDSRSIPADQPTMNYGWLTPDSTEDEVSRVVLHEFGHALGCIHEHQNPAGGIKWNKPVVYAYYAGPPNYWSKEQVDHNLFEKYDQDLTAFSELDPMSIMMYPIDKRFTLDGFEVRLNTDLSDVDKRFIRELYS